jgi:hypothetical protein
MYYNLPNLTGVTRMATSRKKENILWKNIRGVFYTGYKISSPSYERSDAENDEITGITNYLSPFIFVLHTALLPVTLTVGAGLKTLIDLATRNKPFSDQDIENSSRIIDNSQPDQLDTIANVITSSNPSSVSSKQILHTINELKKQDECQKKQYLEKMEKNFADEKAKFLTQDLKSAGSSIRVSYELTAEDKLVVARQQSEKLAEISKSNMALMKDSIKKYFTSPDNNGKKLHLALHTQLSTFDRNRKKAEEKEKHQQSTTSIYVDSNFEQRVSVQIHRLRNNGKWWKLGIGNNAKAKRIEDALLAFNQSKTAENMNALKFALDERRLGVLTGFDFVIDNNHTTAYAAVFCKLTRR